MAIPTTTLAALSVVMFACAIMQASAQVLFQSDDMLCYQGDQCSNAWCSHYGGVCVESDAGCQCYLNAATADSSPAMAQATSAGASMFAALLGTPTKGKGGKPAVEHTQAVNPKGTINDLLCIGLDQCTNVWCRLHGGECVDGGAKGGCTCDFSSG